MPYTKEEARRRVDALLDQVAAIVKKYPDPDLDGEANYAISRLVATIFRPHTGWRYHWLARAHSVFGMAANEFTRRLVNPYEDRCAAKNGDVEFYKEFAGD